MHQEKFFLDHSTLDNVGDMLFRNVADHSNTQRHLPEDLDPQLHRCEDLKTRKTPRPGAKTAYTTEKKHEGEEE